MADEVDRGPARLRKSNVTAGSHHEPAFTPGAGTVVGAPRHWLRLEGATLLAGALIAYTTTNQPWWLIPLTLLIPDISAVGYLAGARLGARLYNVAHVTLCQPQRSPLGGGNTYRWSRRSGSCGWRTSAWIVCWATA